MPGISHGPMIGIQHDLNKRYEHDLNKRYEHFNGPEKHDHWPQLSKEV